MEPNPILLPILVANRGHVRFRRSAPGSIRGLTVLVGSLAALIAGEPAVADPVFTSRAPTNATVGERYSYRMSAINVRRSDHDDDGDDDGDDDDDDNDDDRDRGGNRGPRLRFRALDLPRWLEFDGRNMIFGTPGSQHVGRHRVRLRARAGGEFDNQSFTITVAERAPAPEPDDRPDPDDSPPVPDQPPLDPDEPPPEPDEPQDPDGPSPTPAPQEADLAASIAASPAPALVGEAVTWTLTASNDSSVDVANLVLETVFSGDGDMPYSIDSVADEACSLEPRGGDMAVTCRWAPLAAGRSRSVDVVANATQAGEIVAVSTVSISDSNPVDGTADNDEARFVLSVTETRNTSASQELSAPGVVAVTVEDFDGDGRDDVAAATGRGEATLVFLNAADPGESNFRPLIGLPLSIEDASEAAAIASGDLDSDGNADIVVANADGSNHVLFNDGSAGFERIELPGAAGTKAVAIGDVDADGLLDIAFAGEGTNTVHRNLGARQFTAGEAVGPGPTVAVVAVDLTGDGRAALVFAHEDRNAEVYRHADGSYSNAGAIETGPASSIAAMDLGTDGAPDLVFGRRGAADLVFVNTPAGAPSLSLADTLGESATVAVLLEDFDADGRSDIAAVDAGGRHSIYLNDGAASLSFALHPEQFAGRAATDAAIGRFDTGSAADIAVAGSDVVAIFLNAGRGNASGGVGGAPTLTLNGDRTVTINVGDTYEEPGATAIDDADGDLTDMIVIDNGVDTNIIGSYTVGYSVEDSAGNRTTATRTVEVRARDASGGGGGAVGLALLILSALGVSFRCAASAGRRPRS